MDFAQIHVFRRTVIIVEMLSSENAEELPIEQSLALGRLVELAFI